MRKQLDFNKEFGKSKIINLRDFKSCQISIHPIFSDIFLCYEEFVKSLKTDLTVLISKSELHLWHDPKIRGYVITNYFQWFLYCSTNGSKIKKLRVHSFPQNFDKIELLKKEVSMDFLSTLSSYRCDLDKLNPQKLLTLINKNISREIIINLNKEYSQKPHQHMSLELLSEKLGCTRNQLNSLIKAINLRRRAVFDQLEQSSDIVHRLLNNADFVLSPEELWK